MKSFKEVYINEVQSTIVIVDFENDYADPDEVYDILDDKGLDGKYEATIDMKAGYIYLTFDNASYAAKAKKLLKTTGR